MSQWPIVGPACLNLRQGWLVQWAPYKRAGLCVGEFSLPFSLEREGLWGEIKHWRRKKNFGRIICLSLLMGSAHHTHILGQAASDRYVPVEQYFSQPAAQCLIMYGGHNILVCLQVTTSWGYYLSFVKCSSVLTALQGIGEDLIPVPRNWGATKSASFYWTAWKLQAQQWLSSSEMLSADDPPQPRGIKQ